MLPYTAYLRVYQPVSTYSTRERSYWRMYARSSRRPPRAGAVTAEHEAALRRVVASPPVPVPARESEDAYIRRVGTEVFVCPWQTRLRSWIAFQRFREATSTRLMEAFIPPEAAEKIRPAIEWRHAEGNGTHPQILTSTWSIPLPWFVPFVSSERYLLLERSHGMGDRGGTGTPGRHPVTPQSSHHTRSDQDPVLTPTRVLVYVTGMAEARRRVARATRALRRTVGEGALLEATDRLEEWLSTWSPRALVELDYGGLVRLLNDEQLRADQSVAEVTAAVSGLERGERELTVAMYRRLTRRWRPIQALEHAN